MVEVIVSTIKPDMAELKDEKRQLRAAIERTPADQTVELLLEYAEKCKALGHRFRQEGYEKRAKYEFYEATQARKNAALNYHNIR